MTGGHAGLSGIVARARRLAPAAALLAGLILALWPAVRAPFTVDDRYVLPQAAAAEPSTFLRAWNVDVQIARRGVDLRSSLLKIAFPPIIEPSVNAAFGTRILTTGRRAGHVPNRK